MIRMRHLWAGTWSVRSHCDDDNRERIASAAARRVAYELD